LEDRGVKTVSCDLLDERAVARLPEAPSVIYLVGLKFGTAQNPAATWAMNTIVPARVAGHFSSARIVALSTGNVYPMSPTSGGGSIETDPLTPLGEYANAAVGRERIFEFYARENATRLALLRLFYAVELRYGVLVDLARMIQQGQPIPLANGHFNCIWQGDANEMIIRSLALAATPPAVFNLCQPEMFSVREIATRLGQLMNRTPQFTGMEAPDALIANATAICAAVGTPATSIDTILPWVADWVTSGRRNLGRPTHFEVRDGRY
jgi:nucleoside-diphosphate-sugar epimerase